VWGLLWIRSLDPLRFRAQESGLVMKKKPCAYDSVASLVFQILEILAWILILGSFLQKEGSGSVQKYTDLDIKVFFVWLECKEMYLALSNLFAIFHIILRNFVTFCNTFSEISQNKKIISRPNPNP
jgi:hypothetical protein